MVDISRRRGDEEMELAALIALGNTHAIPTPVQNPQKAAAFAEDGLALARRLGDQAAEAQLLWILLLVYMYSGHMDEGIPYGEQSAELARELGTQNQLAHALQDLALAYMAVGDLARSREVLDESFRHWEALNNKPMQAENRTNLASLRAMTGNLDEAIEYFDAGFRIADAIDNDWGRANNRLYLAYVYFALGEIGRAIEIHTRYLPLARSVGHPGTTLLLVFQGWLYRFIGADNLAREAVKGADWDSEDFPPFRQLALAANLQQKLADGDAAGAAELIEPMIELNRQKTITQIEIDSAFAEIEYWIHTGEHPAAADRLGQIFELIERSGARFFLPGAEQLRARVRIAEGDPDSAAACLEAGAEIAREIGHRAVLMEILIRLAALETQRGNPARAEACRSEARQVGVMIAGTIGDPELIKSFVDRLAAEGISL
jgi:tetratricopeptide (TPR) repeat protein